MFSQPVLVALNTAQGVVYAPASGWDRVYLLWTFRNFRSLPQTVLNPRQQQLIGSLYRDASSHQGYELHQAVVIGRIEDFNPSTLATRPEPARIGKPGVPEKKSTSPGQPFYARLLSNGMTLKVGAAALVAIIAVLAWHQLGAQPISRRSTQTEAAAHPSDEISPAPGDMNLQEQNPATVEPSPDAAPAAPSPTSIASPSEVTAPADRSAVATQTGAALPVETSALLVKTPSKTDGLATQASVPTKRVAKAHPPASPSAYETAIDEPRIQISGRPQKLVYPVCPQTRARGKVSLQAVVGYDGAVSRVRVLTGDRVLAAAAVEAVRQWRYQPSPGAAQRLERETNITVSFISNEVVAVSFPNSAPLSR